MEQSTNFEMAGVGLPMEIGELKNCTLSAGATHIIFDIKTIEKTDF